MEERKDFSVPMNWIDRIFDIMSELYKEKWDNWQGAEKTKSMYKTIWSHGLHGLTPDEIKNAILILRNAHYIKAPPLATEFFDYAKGKQKLEFRPYEPPLKINTELARRSIDQIKSMLRGRRST